jgi:adenylosuccinate synthase
MRALIVVDLAFGDSGKGLLTDFLVRRTGARMVVRYNGGAQAGHNVVAPDGRHHTFSQFGAGTLVPGVETFLSRHMVVHPTALLVEEAHLRSIGVTDALERLRVSERALVVTPFHQAAGRLRELARGAARHGSCGVGMGETVAHAIAAPDDAIRTGDLRDLPRLRQTLRRVRERMHAEVAALDVDGGPARAELAIFERSDVADQWLASSTRMAPLIAGDASWAREAKDVVFEGAQGVLLDELHGFHPYTTWSRCTTAPAMELVSECIPSAEVRRIGVLRTYAVRHGPGPFPTESRELASTPPDHNRLNEWQGEVRRGWFDAVLARYAIGGAGEIDALAITHLDWLTKLTNWTYCDAYDPAVPLDVPAHSVERQSHLASLLASTRPVLRHCPATEGAVLERIEILVGKPVAIGSRGPTAEDVFIRMGGDSWH